MVSIKFHLRESKRGEGHPVRLFARIIALRKTASVTLPYKLFPHEWDQQKQTVTTTAALPARRQALQEIARKMERDKALLQQIATEKTAQGAGQTLAAGIVHSFNMQRSGFGLKKITTFFSDELKANRQERTARAYRSGLSALCRFTGRDDLSPREINETLLGEFQNWLTARGLKLNTVSFYMRNIRAVYNKAVTKGWATPFAGGTFKKVYTSVAPTQKRALPTPEMRKLDNLLEEPQPLEKKEQTALALFLFAFHGRGISFVDLAFLKKENIKKGYLHYNRRKTGTPLSIRVIKPMKKILRFFAPQTKGSPYLFPLIPSTAISSHDAYQAYQGALSRQNVLLKRVAEKAGLSGNLTTHMARHSWATVAKRENIPIAVISEALGHSSVETTYRYLDSFETPVIDRAARKVSGSLRRKAG